MRARRSPPRPAGTSVAQRSAAERELDTALGQVLALGQSYPQLELVEQLPEPAGQSRRHREQARVRPPVLQRRGRHAEPSRSPRSRGCSSRRSPGCPNASTTRSPAEARLVRIVFAGTPEPALPVAAATHRLATPRRGRGADAARRRVGSARQARRRRRSPRLALDAGIPVLRPERPNGAEFVAELADLAPDCCAVVAYGALLRDGLLAVPPLGWINLHFSLLPAWRGAAPVQAAIAAGDEVTGATTFRIEPSLDSGPVFGVVTETVRPTDTAGDLLERLSVSGSVLLERTLDGIADGSLTAVPQPADGVTVAPKITVEEARVRWDLPAHVVDRRIRAVTPNPGAWTMIGDLRVKVGPGDRRPADEQESLPPGDDSRRPPGSARRDRRQPPVLLGEIQPPGKKPMKAADWAAAPASTRTRARGDPAAGQAAAAAQAPRSGSPGRLRRAARGLRTRRLRQPRPARAAPRTRDHRARRRLRHRTRLRHVPRLGPARRRHRRTRRTARSTASTPSCSTCCGSAPINCCAPGSTRTPPSTPPSSRRRSNSTRRVRVSSTACCARSRPATSSPGWPNWRRPPAPTRSATSPSPTRTRGGSGRRSPTRSAPTPAELGALLASDDERPLVHLAARPGVLTAEELAAGRRRRGRALLAVCGVPARR